MIPLFSLFYGGGCACRGGGGGVSVERRNKSILRKSLIRLVGNPFC